MTIGVIIDYIVINYNDTPVDLVEGANYLSNVHKFWYILGFSYSKSL